VIVVVGGNTAGIDVNRRLLLEVSTVIIKLLVRVKKLSCVERCVQGAALHSGYIFEYS
jgi:hypothetical protein